MCKRGTRMVTKPWGFGPKVLGGRSNPDSLMRGVRSRVLAQHHFYSDDSYLAFNSLYLTRASRNSG